MWWLEARQAAKGGFGYGTEDIFYLEVCLFNHICSNGHQLFELGVGDTFICEFSQVKFDQLEVLLSQTPIEGLDEPDPVPCGGVPPKLPGHGMRLRMGKQEHLP